MAEKGDIENIFYKELQWIKDEKLKESVINVWKEAADRGKWQNIEDAPFTILI